MNNKQIIGMVVAAILFVGVSASSILVNSISNKWVADSTSEWEMLSEELSNEFATMGMTAIEPPMNDYIGVVSVVGTIQEQTYETSLFGSVTQGYQHDTMIEYVNTMIVDDYNKGILLYVDSPGGTVYESEELYSKLCQYQEETGRPVWTYMAHYAASGGYYVTAAADKIYANLNTTTGSIGVIISGCDMTGLYDKLGIQQVNIVSGDNKASNLLDEDQVAIYQAIVDESYERFTSIVAEGREIPLADVKELADGRIYTATQAQKLGLVDEISTYEEMQADMEAELGVYEYYAPSTSADIFSSFFTGVSDMIPKSEAEILVNLTEDLGNGVPMYYAEQLQ